MIRGEAFEPVVVMKAAATQGSELLVWDAGQDWAAAIRQLSQGDLQVAVSSEYDELCSAASQNPYAVSLWEVNLSNWEDRARRLSDFLRTRPTAGVCISAERLPLEVQALFRELGVLMILADRLAGVALLRLLERQRQRVFSKTRDLQAQIATPLPWLRDTHE